MKTRILKPLIRLVLSAVLLGVLFISCSDKNSTSKEVGNFIDVIVNCPDIDSMNLLYGCFKNQFRKYKTREPYSEDIYGILVKEGKMTDYTIYFILQNSLPNDSIEDLYISLSSSKSGPLSITSNMIVSKLGYPDGVNCENDSVWIIRNGFLRLDKQIASLIYSTNDDLLQSITHFNRFSLPLRESVLQTMQSDSQYVQFHRIRNSNRLDPIVLTLYGIHNYYTISLSENGSQRTIINFELTYRKDSISASLMQINLDTIINNYGSLFSKLELSSYYQDLERALNHLQHAPSEDKIMFRNEPEDKILHMIRGNIIIQIRKIIHGNLVSFQIGFFPICDPPVYLSEIRNF